LVIDERREGQKVEQIREKPPYISVAVFAETLIIEAVYLCDLPWLMITAKNGDAVPVAQLESDKEGDSLDRVVSAIYVVAHEEIIGIWGVTPDSE
jgi:hypothetical protein